MSGDKEVKYEITGNADGLAAAMSQAQQVIGGATSQIQGHLNNVGEAFKKVNAVLLSMAAIVAGGAFFKEAIARSRELTGEATNLSKRLGITTEEASALRTALHAIGSDGDAYVGAFEKFARQLKTNEEGMNALGIKTRDTSGHLRDSNDVFQDAIHLVETYKPGLDQTEAAQYLFGKSVEEVMKYQKLNNAAMEEARQKNEALGLTVTQQGVQASKAYGKAMADVKLVLDAVMNTIGEAVMPVFTAFGQYLSEAGPTIVGVFKGAIVGLMAVFRGLGAVVEAIAEQIFGFFDQMGRAATGVADVWSRLMKGDFSGAWAAAKAAAVDVGNAGGKSFAESMADAWQKAVDGTSSDMDRMFGPKTDMGAGKKGGSDFHAPSSGGASGGDASEKSAMADYEATLSKWKETYAQINDGRELDKQHEVAYWEAILLSTDVAAGDRLKIETKVSAERVAILRREKAQRDGVNAEEARTAEQIALEQVTRDRVVAEAQLATGEISHAQMAQLEIQFEQRRYQIQSSALKAKLDLLAQDPTMNPVEYARIKGEIEVIDEQHSTKMIGLQNQAALQVSKPWTDSINSIRNGLTNVLGNAIQGLITRTMTLGQAMRSIWKGITATVVGEISTILAKKAAAWAVDKALTLAGIGAKAAEAGAGAASSVANIPYVGPILAIAAMASVFGAVSGLKANVSAAGGYDIPAGINPVVQTHAREMILPAKHADVIRSLADNGAGGGSGDVHFHGTPLRGGFFMAHQDDLVKAIRDAQKGRRL